MGGCSSQETVDESEVEYRKDKSGSKILYKIGDSRPFGQGKVGRVSGRYANGQKRFEIGFVNGLRHGTFHFWRDNGVKELSGAYDNGKRDGTFIAYGKAGELVYEKNFVRDNLDGNFTLYYPFSHSEIFRYTQLCKDEGVDYGDIQVRSIRRLKANFSKGNPTGKYQVYYHPRGQSGMSELDLLKEEGSFDEKGNLIGDQTYYYPRTESLIVYMPDEQPHETIHPPTEAGLSRAIDECYKLIKELPAYRNPKQLPAKVFAVDSRGNRIAPIWSSDVDSMAIRNMDGFLLPFRFDTTFETYRDDALTKASDVLSTLELSEPEKVSEYMKMGASIEVVGLNSEGQVIDILWSSRKQEGVTPLESRILSKRAMIKRAWDSGDSPQAEWLIPDGLRLVIQDTQEEPVLFMPR